MKALLIIWITVFIAAIVVVMLIDNAVTQDILRQQTEQCKEVVPNRSIIKG